MTLDMRALTGAAMILLLAGSLAALLFAEIPPANRELAIALISGVVGASVKDITGFYFGSSRGSAAKDQTIAELSARRDAAPETPPAG